jgi:hypothetical protein
MSKMRPILSEINAHGFVTIDSQAGKRIGTYKQRAYISGFMSRERSVQFSEKMLDKDCILTFVYPHDQPLDKISEDFVWKSMPRLPLTITGSDVNTQHPLAIAEPFKNLWRSMLPELQLQEDEKTMLKIKKNSAIVFTVDLQWGRRDHLFKMVLAELAR